MQVTDQRILVLGASGMLGHKVFQALSEEFPWTYGTIQARKDSRRYAAIELMQGDRIIPEVDATDFSAVQKLFDQVRPTVVINCVGVIKQRDAAKAAIPSILVNSLLPHKLAEMAQMIGARVIHFSTDCVFNGKRGSYVETDVSDAEDLYGKSKFLGEVQAPNAVTLRTSIIGRELANFQSLLEWFLAQEGRTVRGFTRALYSGTTTNELAEIIKDLLLRSVTLSGLYQVCGPVIPKYDLLCIVREKFSLDIEIVPDDTFACDRSMIGDKFRLATGYKSPAWNALIERLAADPTPYWNWRKLVSTCVAEH